MKTIDISKKFFTSLAKDLIKNIKSDAKNGILQNPGEKSPTRQYVDRSKYSYADYKSKGMTRYTDGQKLRRYASQSIVSTRTDKVDMMLTGRLLESLGIKSVTKTGFTLEFTDPEAERKLSGNLVYDRVLAGINDKNFEEIGEKVKGSFDKSFSGKLKAFSTKVSLKV